ncbi:ATP-binding cassette domain-containing protein [uncultured Ruthenibacterium sp.]|uniref:ABC transporter ATP-binding protein/permease n=1 Tax=uncultured Ruthenibacterium sp. TaxID=1905347 RepID=UPI00349E8211
MIELNNISKKYGDQIVLDGFSYTFGENGITCLLGASGSGKSTLLNLLAGFDREYSGKILVDGQALSELSDEDLCEYRKHTIGFVFQEYHLLTGYTVLENILLAAELTCQDNAKNREWALSLLRRLNIEEKANEKIENLSGGQKQRVAIARALAGNPQVILADEPTGALDRKTADEIMAILSEIAKQSPVLIITHDRKICDYADEVVTIEDGKCRVWKEAKKQAVTVLMQKEALPDVPVSMFKRALHNFKTHLKRFLGVSLAVTIAVCAILMSFSSQNIIEEKINHFEQKNTAFSWGQILLKENDKVEDVLSLLERSPDIQQYYIQYPVPECKIEFGGHSLSVSPKQFGSISNESMNIGVMPRDGEIAITPSLAKQFAQDIRTLIGKEIVFSCGNFSRKLQISGIYSGSFDDYYLDAKTEQELYGTLQGDESPVSVTYQVNGFDEVLEVVAQLTEQGIVPITAAKQVESLKETFLQLQTMFILVSVFIVVIALTISGMLLMKLARMRSGEIGLLMALGYHRGQIQKMLLWESLLLSSLSALTTTLFALLLTTLSGILPVHIAPLQFAGSICGTVLLVWFITAIANAKLLRTDPAKALRE